MVGASLDEGCYARGVILMKWGLRNGGVTRKGGGVVKRGFEVEACG